MKNGFFDAYYHANNYKSFYLNRNNIKSYIDNYNNPNFLSATAMNKLKFEIKNKINNNNPQLVQRQNNFKSEKSNSLKNIGSKGSKHKSDFQKELFFLKDRHFLREFENLFEHTTSSRMVNYSNGEKVEKMKDFLKMIKEFNYNTFMKNIKRHKRKNKEAYKVFTSRHYSAQPFNYKQCSFSNNLCRKNKKSNNYSCLYLSTINDTIGSESNYNNSPLKTMRNRSLDRFFETNSPLKTQTTINNSKTRRTYLYKMK